MFKLRRLFRRFVLLSAMDGEGGGSSVVDVVATEAAPAAPEVVAAPAAPVEAKPATMLEAMNSVFNRDEKGRFAGKTDAPAEPGAQPVAAAPAVPTAPKAEEDPTAMPEGLGQKAQERFQKLAGTVKEVTAERDMLTQQVSYVRDTFQQHGIKQEQFEQAAGIIGAMNRGDYATVQRMLTQQLQQVSLLSGQPVGGIDALEGFPDLRQAVDSLQISESAAMELARHRKAQEHIQGHQQRQQQEQQTSQARQQEFQSAQNGVDHWVKTIAKTDIDWPVIEEQLLPDIGNLLKGVPPQAWLGVLQAQYNTLKRAAGAFRRTASPGAAEPTPLRPMGAGATQRAPQNMHEAMWGTSPRA